MLTGHAGVVGCKLIKICCSRSGPALLRSYGFVVVISDDYKQYAFSA